MIVKKGDLFESGARMVGHGVNCKGVMGAGIAKLFAKRYPEMLQEYREACRAGELKPGGMLPWQAPEGTWILNMASQDKPGPDAKLEWLALSAHRALALADREGITAVALPQIGCGIGGLEWEAVACTLEQVERNYRAHFEIFVLE